MAQRIVAGEQYESFLIRGGIDGGPVPVVQGLSVPAHDFIALAYSGTTLTGVTYKTGGGGGTTVATLALAYSGTTLLSVAKS
jgi:hypothetical protein